MIMSHYGISAVIKAMLYDRQNLSGVSHYQSTHTRPVTANCIARGTDLLAIMKSLITAATPVHLRRIVFHTHMNQRCNQCLYRKGKISDEFREWRTGATEIMFDRIII